MNTPVKMPYIPDSQAALAFVTGQRSHIETEVMKREYPEIRYSELIPVDTSAADFAPSVTFFSQDHTGKAKFINGKGNDVPLVNLTRTKFEQTVNMGGIGYEFSLEEIGAAQQMNINLSNEGAEAARQAYEQHVDEVAFLGETELGVEGLLNMTGINSVAATGVFTGTTLTAQQILADINGQITAVHASTLGIDMIDTLLMPLQVYGDLATRQLAPESDTTIMDFIQRKNMYTVSTGRPLTIAGTHRLTDTMVMYKRDPKVVKMHMPMPLRFIAPQAIGLSITTLGMYRFAPVNIRRPGAFRYLTGVAA